MCYLRLKQLSAVQRVISAYLRRGILPPYASMSLAVLCDHAYHKTDKVIILIFEEKLLGEDPTSKYTLVNY